MSDTVLISSEAITAAEAVLGEFRTKDIPDGSLAVKVLTAALPCLVKVHKRDRTEKPDVVEMEGEYFDNRRTTHAVLELLKEEKEKVQTLQSIVDEKTQAAQP